MSGVYSAYKQSLLDSSAPDLTTAAVKLVLVDGADYTIDLATHDFLADIPAIGRVAMSGALANKTITGGTFDADNMAPAWTAVTGDPCEIVAMIVDSGTDTTSPLISVWDAGTGLPVTPNGGDINASWASYIFRV